MYRSHVPTAGVSASLLEWISLQTPIENSVVYYRDDTAEGKCCQLRRHLLRQRYALSIPPFAHLPPLRRPVVGPDAAASHRNSADASPSRSLLVSPDVSPLDQLSFRCRWRTVRPPPAVNCLAFASFYKFNCSNRSNAAFNRTDQFRLESCSWVHI